MTLSIAEIVNKACELKTNEEKVQWLRANSSMPLKNILSLMYNKHKFKFNIPTKTPPYAKSEYPDSQGMLYREARKLKYFVEGYGGDKLHAYRREALFIQMLESVDKHDAELLCKMIAQKPLKGLPAAVINEALGDVVDIKEKAEEKNNV